jgi:hypothetical protein
MIIILTIFQFSIQINLSTPKSFLLLIQNQLSKMFPLSLKLTSFNMILNLTGIIDDIDRLPQKIAFDMMGHGHKTQLCAFFRKVLLTDVTP